MTSDSSVPGGPLSTTLAERPAIPDLEMRLYDRDGWSVIAISGELDMQGVPELRRLLLLARHRLVLDMRRLTFVDCGGLRTLVGPSAEAASSPRRIVSEENGHVRRLLRLTGWENSVSVYSTVDAAVRPLT